MVPFFLLYFTGVCCIAFSKTALNIREESMCQNMIEDVLEERTPELMSVPGVTGTGISAVDDTRVILVYVKGITPQLEKKIRLILEGYPVIIEETGGFRSLPGNE